MHQVYNPHQRQIRLLKPGGNRGATDFADEEAEAQKREESCMWSQFLANLMDRPSMLCRPLANGVDAVASGIPRAHFC